MAGKIKNYTENVKKQIVFLKQRGKLATDIVKKYQVAKLIMVKL